MVSSPAPTDGQGISTPPPPYSRFRVAGGVVYTCGHTPLLSDGRAVSDDFDEQAHQVLAGLRETLESAGSGLDQALKVNAYLQNLEDAPAFNTIYRQYFGDPFPARTTVQAGLPGFLLEVDAVAGLRT